MEINCSWNDKHITLFIYIFTHFLWYFSFLLGPISGGAPTQNIYFKKGYIVFLVNISQHCSCSHELFFRTRRRWNKLPYIPWSMLQVLAPNISLVKVNNKLGEIPQIMSLALNGGPHMVLNTQKALPGCYHSQVIHSVVWFITRCCRYQKSYLIQLLSVCLCVCVCGSTVTPGGSWKKELMRC